MKMLMLYAHAYTLKPHEPSLPDAEPEPPPMGLRDVLVAWIHVEPADVERQERLVTKAIKQLKWLARKMGTRNVVLHSFAHLAKETAPAPVARDLLQAMGTRLRTAGYTVHGAPFGWFNEFSIHVGGPSLAKVFVDL